MQVAVRIADDDIVVSQVAFEFRSALVRVDRIELQNETRWLHFGLGFFASPGSDSHQRECAFDSFDARQRSLCVLRARNAWRQKPGSEDYQNDESTVDEHCYS